MTVFVLSSEGKLHRLMLQGMCEVSADVLWQLNNEYTQRLSRARTALEMVGRLLNDRVGSLLERGEDTPDKRAAEQLLAVLGYCHDRLTILNEEHRDWRYRYFYESPDSKRVVQDDLAVNQAIARFSRMRAKHERVLKELDMLIDAVPQPESTMTTVSLGDLWTILRNAIENLLSFGDFMQQFSA